MGTTRCCFLILMLLLSHAALASAGELRFRRHSGDRRPDPEPHLRENPGYSAAGYPAVLHPMRGPALKGLLLEVGNDYQHVPHEDPVRDGNGTRRAHLGRTYKTAWGWERHLSGKETEGHNSVCNSGVRLDQKGQEQDQP